MAISKRDFFSFLDHPKSSTILCKAFVDSLHVFLTQLACLGGGGGGGGLASKEGGAQPAYVVS